MKRKSNKPTISELLNNARKSKCRNCGDEFTTPYLKTDIEGRQIIVDSVLCRRCNWTPEERELASQQAKPQSGMTPFVEAVNRDEANRKSKKYKTN